MFLILFTQICLVAKHFILPVFFSCLLGLEYFIIKTNESRNLICFKQNGTSMDVIFMLAPFLKNHKLHWKDVDASKRSFYCCVEFHGLKCHCTVLTMTNDRNMRSHSAVTEWLKISSLIARSVGVCMAVW